MTSPPGLLLRAMTLLLRAPACLARYLSNTLILPFLALALPRLILQHCDNLALPDCSCGALAEGGPPVWLQACGGGDGESTNTTPCVQIVETKG